MKTRLNYLIKGLFAFAIVALFVQCKGETTTTNSSTNAAAENAVSDAYKIAYVEMDSLLLNYNYWNDVTEAMMKKQEDMNATLNQKQREFQNEVNEFQRKIQNNAFLSRERAEQEQARLMKREQEVQNLANKLAQEYAAEDQKNSLDIRDAINSFIKEYNKEKGYTFILSNSGNSNLLYADKAYDITKEVVDGLNARYSAPDKK